MTTYGFHVPAGTDRTPVEQRILEQSRRLRGDGAVTGWASLRLQGGGFFDGIAPDGRTVIPVPLAAGTGRLRDHEAIEHLRIAVRPDEVVIRHGVRCVSPEPAVFAEMCRVGQLREAVVALDMACAARLTSLRRFTAWLEAQPPRRGLVLARCALERAVEESWSPMESRLRLIWELDLGWQRPLCNQPVYGDGKLLGISDLFDPAHGLAAEFSGADHRTKKTHRNDVRRAEAFRRAGVEAAEFVGADLDDLDLVVDRLSTARERAGTRPQTWTLTAPDGYATVVMTVDDELDHRDLLRARALEWDECHQIVSGAPDDDHLVALATNGR